MWQLQSRKEYAKTSMSSAFWFFDDGIQEGPHTPSQPAYDMQRDTAVQPEIAVPTQSAYGDCPACPAENIGLASQTPLKAPLPSARNKALH